MTAFSFWFPFFHQRTVRFPNDTTHEVFATWQVYTDVHNFILLLPHLAGLLETWVRRRLLCGEFQLKSAGKAQLDVVLRSQQQYGYEFS